VAALNYPVYAVAEATPRFATQVRNLALSAQRCGASVQVGVVRGEAGGSTWGAGFTGRAAVEMVVVERVSARFPHANKLAGLGRIVADRPSWGVLSDCDIVFERPAALAGTPDGTSAGSSAVLRADPANHNRVPLAVWQRLSEQLREPAIGQRAADGQLPYVNSGLLHVGAAVQADLHREWQRAVLELAAVTSEQPRRTWQFYLDQIALTVAIGRLGIDVAPLPAGENIPTHIRTKPRRGGAVGSLHYHDAHTPEGFLLPAYSSWLQDAVAAANTRLSEHLGRPVPSLTAASLRYRWHRRGRAAKHALQRH
jgi:hypothetical protein